MNAASEGWHLQPYNPIRRDMDQASLKLVAGLLHRDLPALASRLRPVSLAHLLVCLPHSRRALPDIPPTLTLAQLTVIRSTRLACSHTAVLLPRPSLLSFCGLA